jgi:hypothetical protein
MELGLCVSTDFEGRTIFVADAHCGDGKRFIVRADEMLTAFLELERAVCIHLLIETNLAKLAHNDGKAFRSWLGVLGEVLKDACRRVTMKLL